MSKPPEMPLAAETISLGKLPLAAQTISLEPPSAAPPPMAIVHRRPRGWFARLVAWCWSWVR